MAASERDAVLDMVSATNSNPRRPLLPSAALSEEEEDFIDRRVGRLPFVGGGEGRDLWEADANGHDTVLSRCVRHLCGLSYRTSMAYNERFQEAGMLTILFALVICSIIHQSKNEDINPLIPDPPVARGNVEKRCFPLTGWQMPDCTTCDVKNWQSDPDCNTCKPGHYGAFCNRTCPGMQNQSEGTMVPACSGHGFCDDGVYGTGKCSCNVLWRGDLWRNPTIYDCASFNYVYVFTITLAFVMTPFWAKLGECSRSKDPRCSAVFGWIWWFGRTSHPSNWLAECCCCCCFFRDNPRARASAKQRQDAFRMSPPRYHVFQGMVQGSFLLLIALIASIPKIEHFYVLLPSIATISIVLILTRKQGTIYGQSVMKLAGQYVAAQTQVEEKKADIQKLQGAYLIAEEDVTFTNRLSAGGFGEVWKGTFKRLPGLPVAIKKIFLTPENMDLILEMGIFGDKEIKLLMRLNNERVVTFFGAGTLRGSGQPFLVSEFMDGGDLRQLLDARAPAWPERVQIALDVADGMAYLHSVGLLHRDLKSLNVLLEKSSNRAKITDFGASRFTKEVQSRSLSSNDTRPNIAMPSGDTPGGAMKMMDAKTGAVGTLAWMAPEIMRQLRGNTVYGLASDVYSFGVVVYELLTLRAPWDRVDPPFALNTMRAVLAGGRPEVTEAVKTETRAQRGGDALLEMMRQCWDQDPSERPTFVHISASLRMIV